MEKVLLFKYLISIPVQPLFSVFVNMVSVCHVRRESCCCLLAVKVDRVL